MDLDSRLARIDETLTQVRIAQAETATTLEGHLKSDTEVQARISTLMDRLDARLEKSESKKWWAHGVNATLITTIASITHVVIQKLQGH